MYFNILKCVGMDHECNGQTATASATACSVRRKTSKNV